MTDEDFVAAIEASPDDASQRAVYADWLEQQGDPRAELVRLENDLWRRPIDLVRFRRQYPRRVELRAKFDPRWGARIARPSTAEIRRRLAALAELNPEREDGYNVRDPLTEAQLAYAKSRDGGDGADGGERACGPMRVSPQPLHAYNKM